LVPLSSIRPKDHLTFISCPDALLAAKLADIGMLPGSLWQVLQRAPLHGPIIMSNGQTQLCIRREDAKKLLVEEAK